MTKPQEKFDGATPVQFRCRESGCGSTKMFEYMSGVTVSSECRIGAHGLEYEDQTNEDGEVVNFQCENGHVIHGSDGEPITTSDDLIQFFGDHPLMSHADAVDLIAERLHLISGEALVEEFSRHYPADDLRYIGDSMYVRGNDDV